MLSKLTSHQLVSNAKQFFVSFLHKMRVLIYIFLLLFATAQAQEFPCSTYSQIIDDTKFFKRTSPFSTQSKSNVVIPPTFDARKKWPYCKSIKRIKKQGKCGACWAFATTSVIADRICIASKGKYDIDISVLDLMQCCANCTGSYQMYVFPACEGFVYPNRAFEWFVNNGIATGGEKGCKPLEQNLTIAKYTPDCIKNCTNSKKSISYEEDKWYGKEWYVLDIEGSVDKVKLVQAELMLHGPVQATIKLDIEEAPAQVPRGHVISFIPNPISGGAPFIPHEVKLIGWDVKPDGTPVWIIANSFGKNWCDDGFCSVGRGANDTALEFETIMGVIPKLKVEKKAEKEAEKKAEKKAENGSCNMLRVGRFDTLTFVILTLNLAFSFVYFM